MIIFSVFTFSIIFNVIINLFSCSLDNLKEKKRVVLIGIDGLLKKCMKEANTTSFEYFKQEGSYTKESRTIIETTSGPGWVSILCGMSSEETGVYDNSWIAPWMFEKKAKIRSITNNAPFPCLFYELKRNKPDLNIKVTWDWNWFVNLGNISIPGSIDKEYFCDPYPDREIASFDKCDKEMLNNAMESIKEDFDFLFIYFISVDSAGHLFNFCSEEYIERISIINTFIEIILQSLKDNYIFDNTYLIITTDHGASYMKKWHGFQDDDNLITPMYIIGPGIKKNHKINKYTQNKDLAPTIMNLFGFEPNNFWSGKRIEDIFEFSHNYPSLHNSNFENLKFLNE
jgi:predicted AlkP superfamily pyrophosphatase or phosphodiesterase